MMPMSSQPIFWIVALAVVPALILLGKICSWWWSVVVARDSDVYGGRYDWISIPAVPFTILCMPASIGALQGQWDLTGAPVYALLFFFGPMTFIAGFIRFCGFGKTRLGRALGFLPPTEDPLSPFAAKK